jgi:hypothetical protein
VDVGIGFVGAFDRLAGAADPLGGLVELLGDRERLLIVELGQPLAVDAWGGLILGWGAGARACDLAADRGCWSRTSN